jgi:hypothetical protein
MDSARAIAFFHDEKGLEMLKHIFELVNSFITP